MEDGKCVDESISEDQVMDETTKCARRRRSEGFYDRFIVGHGIDIGCGRDKIDSSAVGYDLESGDAQRMDGFEDGSFDYVYSSHCLEHMRDPREAILNWWRLVKPGGHLIVAIPDEDLYEQGIVPSVFNPDHKITFTISKERSWSPVSVNILDLVHILPRRKVIYIKTMDRGYDYTKLGTNEDQTLGDAEAGIEFVVQKVREELPRRTTLQQLILCPECGRMELTMIGVDQGGAMNVRCRSCGAPGKLRMSGGAPTE